MATITRREAAAAYKAVKTSGKPVEKYTKAELMGKYYAEARNADIRLRKLEYLADKELYKPATQWAYARAAKDIEARFGEIGQGNQLAFDKSVAKMTKSQIMAALNDVRRFRESPSSTKTGIDKVYRERAKTLNERYGMNIKWDDMAKLLASDDFVTAKKRKGSDRLFKLIALRMKNKNEIKKQIEKSKKRHKTAVTDADVIDFILNDLSKQNITPAELTEIDTDFEIHYFDYFKKSRKKAARKSKK